MPTAPTFHGPHAPLPVRLANALGRQLGGRGQVSLAADDLRGAAARASGLDQWGGDTTFDETLTVLLQYLEREGQLTPFGRFALKRSLIKHLVNRLRVVAALEDHPAINEQALLGPIFIIGWYRTGTTHLHNLLANLPNLRAPLLWELRTPCPPPGDLQQGSDGSGVREARWMRFAHRYLAPSFDTAHAMEAKRPEECLHLFENAAISANSFFVSEMKSFAWWLLEQDLRPAYRFYRAQLQLLQWRRPGGRWLLKWPYHLWHLDALLDVFPDATLVHVHRAPQEAIPSACSLAALARAPMCETIDCAALGRFWGDYAEAGLGRALAVRQRLATERVIDVHHADLVRDPVATAVHIARRCGVEPGDEGMARLRHYQVENPRHKHGVHRYDAAQFGLHDEALSHRFADYTARFRPAEPV